MHRKRPSTGHRVLYGFRSLLFFLVLLGITPGTLVAALESWKIVGPRGESVIEARRERGVLYLRLDELVPYLGGRFLRVTEDDRMLRVDIRDHEILLSAGQSLFNLDGQVVTLIHPVLSTREGWWVPVEWLREVARRIDQLPLAVFPGGHRIALGREHVIPVTLKVQPQATLTRIVLQSPRPLIYQLRRREDGLFVEIQNPDAILPGLPPKVSDRRLEALEIEPGGRRPGLRLKFDPAKYHYRAYTLENPFRFIIDVAEAFNLPENPPETAAVPGPPPATSSPNRRGGNEFDVVVLDPGHGGGDTGTVGPHGVMEKEVTLAVARRLQRYLEARLGVKVFLTRQGDQDVDLDQRTAIANGYNADLFISIHANSALRGRAKGAETYYMSTDWIDEESRRHLKRAEPGAFSRQTGGGDDVLQLILWDLAQTAYLEESGRFAKIIQSTLNSALGISNRGVKQAPFRVLMGARMPAVLIEVGFLDNPDEEKLLKNPVYQDKLARAIYQSVERYVQHIRSLVSPRERPEDTVTSGMPESPR